MRVSGTGSLFMSMSISSNFGTFSTSSILTRRFPLRTKILTHALISQLSFELARPRADFSAHGGITNRPVITEEREKGPQLPLRVRRVGMDEE
jgi:hypothetical protein